MHRNDGDHKCRFRRNRWITDHVFCIRQYIRKNKNTMRRCILIDLVNCVAKCISYLLTPWCRVFLEKLTGLQLVKKFPAFHGTRRFITALTSVRHLPQSWASPIQSHIPTSHLLQIHPNIHPSTPRYPQ